MQSVSIHCEFCDYFYTYSYYNFSYIFSSVCYTMVEK